MSRDPRAEVAIALLEDDRALRESLRRGLREEGFVVWAAATGGEFLQMLQSHQPDLLVVDVGLPDADGRDVCLAARARGVDAPALLSARSRLDDRLSAFASGADDYVTKPFSFEELVARVHALVRRHRRVGSGGSVPGLDPGAMTWRRGESVVALTPTEFRLLAVLAAAGGDVVSRRELMRAAWPDTAFVSGNTLDSFVARVRRKLGDLGKDGPSIVTVHGVGYRLV